MKFNPFSKKNKHNKRLRKKRGVIERQKTSKNTKRQDGRNLFQRIHGTPDLRLLFIVILFLLGGVLMIFSASAYYAGDRGDVFFYAKQQIQWIIIGSTGGYICYLTPMSVFRRISPFLMAIGFLLLLYIIPEALFGHTIIDANGDSITSGLQMPFVEALNGAPRWINLQFFNFQPSEYVKFAFVIYIAAWLTKSRNTKAEYNSKINEHIVNVILPFLVLLGIISVMILVQRDFDTTVVLVLTILSIYYVSGTDFLHTVGSLFILASSLVFGGFALALESYRRQRVETFFHIFREGRPDAADSLSGGFQTWNGLIGLGSGGIFGNGYGESVIKQGYLQEAAYTDSIFAVIGDEFGLFGSITIVLGFLFFTSIGLDIAKNAQNRFESLVAVGMTSLISIQAFLNMAAVLVIIPFGGMPLPFFTYGGSSTLITLMSVGVLLNVSKNAKRS